MGRVPRGAQGAVSTLPHSYGASWDRQRPHTLRQQSSAEGPTLPSGSEWEREQRRRQREAEQAQRAAERQRLVAERAAKQAHVEDRAAESDRRTHEIEQRVATLQTLLLSGLVEPSPFSLKSLRRRPQQIAFDAQGLDRPVPKPQWSDYEPAPPGFLERMFGGRQRYEADVSAARGKFEADVARAAQQDVARKRRLQDHSQQHAAAVREAERDAKPSTHNSLSWMSW